MGRQAVKLPLFDILFAGEVTSPPFQQRSIRNTFNSSKDMIPVLPLVDPVKTSRNKRPVGTNATSGKYGPEYFFLFVSLCPASKKRQRTATDISFSQSEEICYDSVEYDDERDETEDEEEQNISLDEESSDDENSMPGRSK